MNVHYKTVCFILLALGILPSARAAPFSNLDFEDAVVPGDVLPSWTVNNLGPSYNVACLGSSCVSVHDMGSPAPLEGSYSVFLQGGTSGASGELPLIGASISQVGDVPAAAKSIRLLSTTSGVSSDPLISYENLRVTFGGANIPLSLLDTVGDLVTVGGNIGAYAGMTVELEISTVTPEINGPELWAWVDVVSFSSTPVPEPSILMWCAFGAVMVMRNRWLVSCLALQEFCISRDAPLRDVAIYKSSVTFSMSSTAVIVATDTFPH